jgi:hypothetical protein
VCKIIKGVAGRNRQGAGRHQPISVASQRERTGGNILCCILLPLQSYMVCMPSSRVLPLNSSTLLSVPDDWHVNASDTVVLLLVWRVSRYGPAEGTLGSAAGCGTTGGAPGLVRGDGA